MPFTAHPGAALNAIGSINKFFADQITAKGLPAFMPSAVVNFNYPDQPLTYPSFSITHLGSIPREVAQGRYLDHGWKGVERLGLAEISCWESRARASGQHDYNLLVMRDMAAQVFATGAYTPILDVYGSTATATGTGTVVRMSPIDDAPAPQDPNPDVARARLLFRYQWLERATAG